LYFYSINIVYKNLREYSTVRRWKKLKQLKRVVIKEEYVALTGDYRSAIILNQFIYWSERVKDFDKFIDEENRRIENYSPDNPKLEKTNGWIYKTADDLIEECMLVTATKNKSDVVKKGNISRTTILNYIDLLIENGWLEKRNNPNHKWDKTLQYRVDLLKVACDLNKVGYTLQDYKLPESFYIEVQKLNIESTILNNRSPEIENRSSESENGSPEIENRSSESGEQYQRLPIEITLKTTPKKFDGKKSTFNNFEQRTYSNLDDIEKKLLQKSLG
jgi:hypothetical protein